MTATILYPTPTLPALPAVRKTSVWEKMFSGFKIGGKKDDFVKIYEPMPTEQARHVPLSTGVERNTLKVHKRNASGTTRSEAYHRPSMAPSSKSYKTISSRSPSYCSTTSRRSSKKWWRSSNAEENDDLPPAPAIDTKLAVFGSHNPDFSSLSPPVSPGFPRKASYVPRNAAGSFLKSTTNPTMKETVQEDLNEASRRLSAVSGSKPASSLKPISITAVELRKDSYAQPETHGMYSMAGVCDIIDEEQYNKSLVSPTSTKDMAERADSANGSPEFIPTKNESDREPSLIEGITA